MKISVCVAKGKNKEKSEDTVVVGRQIISEEAVEYQCEGINCIAVADGVGGAAGGRDASRFVLKKLSSNIDNLKSEQELRVFFKELNSELLRYGKDVGTPNMATTITGLVFSEENCFLVHAGNTRLYILQGEYLKQITEDQTLYRWLLNTGNLEAAENCNRNVIRSCFGGGLASYAENLVIKKVFESALPITILFTSDGIHEFLDIDTMESLLNSKKSDADILKEMVEMAEANGSEDDKSVILIRNR